MEVVSPELRSHYRRTLVWLGLTTPFWIVGALEDPGPWLPWWGAAAMLDLVGTWLAHPWPGRSLRSTEVPFDGNHMVERLRQFLIIALGEAVLTTGTAVAAAPVRLLTVLAGIASMAVVVTFWAVYFAGSDRLVAQHLTSTPDPLRAARLGLNGGYLVLAALVALAVGNELVVAHPDGDGSLALTLLLFGGTLGYLAARVWYLALTIGSVERVRWLACAALIPAGVAAVALPRLAGLALLLLLAVAMNARLLTDQHA